MPIPGRQNVGPGYMFQPGTPGSPTHPDSATGRQVGPGDTKVQQVLNALRSTIGGPYAYWPAPSGYLEWDAATVKRNGLSCSEWLNWGLKQANIRDDRTIRMGTYGFADAVGKKPIDLSKTYPVGTIVVSELGAEGHVGIISGPGNKVMDSNTAFGMNEKGTLRSTHSWAQWQYAGELSQLGTGNAITNTGGAGNWMSGLLSGLPAAIGAGLLMGLKFLYGYAILRPFDFWCGFSYELVIAVKDDFTTKTEPGQPGMGEER